MIKVMLVDDHELVRTGIRRILEDAGDITVIAEADCGEDAILLAKEHQPDVALMDLNMPGIGGAEATRRLLQSDPNLKIIVITIHAENPYPEQLFKLGVTGYLTKGSPANEMVKAIRTVQRGERFLSGDVAQNMALSIMPGSDNSPFEQLSHREMQVLLMIADGEDLHHMSDKLCISPKTISTYRHRLFDKLNAKNDVELARIAIKYGLVKDVTI